MSDRAGREVAGGGPTGERLPIGVTALGGGHGLHASLSALRRIVDDLTAVVTVADNGGSSGRLRGEFGVLPPGDLRMALAALCGDAEWGQTWERVRPAPVRGPRADAGPRRRQPADRGAVGAARRPRRRPRLDGPPARRTRPGAADGDHADGHHCPGAWPRSVGPAGAHAGARAGGGRHDRRPARRTSPSTPPIRRPVPRRSTRCCTPTGWCSAGQLVHVGDPAPDGSRSAQGTGGDPRAEVLVVLNLEGQVGETPGYAPEDHLAALLEHAPDLRMRGGPRGLARSVTDHETLDQAIASAGAELVVADVAMGDGSPRHDPAKLALAYTRIMGGDPAGSRQHPHREWQDSPYGNDGTGEGRAR